MIKRLSLLAASLVLAGAANADVTTTPVNFNIVNPMIPTDFSSSIQVARFDPSLGLLTKVSLTLDGAMTSALSLLFGTAGSGSANFGTNVTLSLTSPAFGGTAFPDLSLEKLMAATFSEQDRTIDGPLDFDDSITFDFDANVTNLAGFQGGAGTTFGLTCSSKTTYVVKDIVNTAGTTTANDFSSGQSSTSADCIGKIAYTYAVGATNDVPEPGTLALIGLALAGMGFTARRRQAT